MRRSMRRILPLLGVVIGCGGVGDGPPAFDGPPIAFDSGTVRIIGGTDTVVLRVEVASTPDQQEVGLMERTSLAPNGGMIFTYAEVQPKTDAFWMFRTRIPLDIAFVDSAGRIAAILGMDPCESPNPEWCRNYRAGVRYVSALEVNRGFFAGHGIGVGHALRLDRDATR